MIILPAIDLKDGCCVRLRQGRADDKTIYSQDPVAMAKEWQARGARYLHVVDLDGAFQGRPMHAGVIKKIAAAIDIPVEVGGGLRTNEHVDQLLDCGVARAIVGTRAIAEPESLRAMAKQFGERLAVGIDARDGQVQVRGWVETTSTRAVDLATECEQSGVKTLIYTDTATDGMLRGPNVPAMQELCELVSCGVVASGGISSPADIEALVRLGCSNLVGAIVGKALYEQTTTLADLTAALG